MATGASVLAKAKTHLGESGTITWNWYGQLKGQAWCAMFVSRVLAEAGVSPRFKTASVGVADAWLSANATWVKYNDMKEGDIVVYTWSPTGAGNTKSGNVKSHIGIVARRVDSNTFKAVEGNTTDSNGNYRVCVKTRNRKYIYAVYRPKSYSSSSSASSGSKYTGAMPTANIQYGSKGTNVTRWQNFLRWYYASHKSEIKADGIFGKVTKAYTLKFQKEHKLTQDGIVGAKTRASAKASRK